MQSNTIPLKYPRQKTANYAKADGTRSEQESQLKFFLQLSRIIYYNKNLFLFTSKRYENFKNILKIQKRLIIQKKKVIGLYKALVACRQKRNI